MGRNTLKTVALIDADTLVYSATRASEMEIVWDNWLHTLHGDFEDCRHYFDEAVQRIAEKIEAQTVVLTFSDYKNPRWRECFWPPYKSHRQGRQPLMFRRMHEYGHEYPEAYVFDGCEGDDVLGILATDPSFYPKHRKVVCSIDKDMHTLPGYHYNFEKDKDSDDPVKLVGQEEAERFHLFQTLTGDRVDGYIGCPGVGPVKAEAILHRAEYKDMPYWDAIVEAYEKAGLTGEEALLNARLARILQCGDYNIQDGGVRLWQPEEYQEEEQWYQVPKE